MAAPTITGLDATPTFVEDGDAVVIDANVEIGDAELDALAAGDGDYTAATLTVTPDADADTTVFGFAGLTVDGDDIEDGNGNDIAAFTQVAGVLTITFADATSAEADTIAQAITYENTSDTPTADVTLTYSLDGGPNDTDDRGPTVDTIAVANTAVNDAPTVLVEIDDTTVDEDDNTFTLDVSGSFDDGDGDNLSFSADTDGSGLPDWLDFNAATGVFSGTPEQADVGSVDITVTATDGDDSVTDTFTLTVEEVDDTPTVENEIDDQNINEDAAFTFVVPANTFSDEEDDVITLSATLAGGAALPDFLTFDPATRTFSGTPQQADVGTISVEVTATTDGGAITDEFDITIANADDAPQVGDAIEDVTVAEDGAAVNFAVPAGAFTHDDGDDLDYAAVQADGTALPVWLTVDRDTGAITGTPPANFNGTIGVVLTAFDDDFETAQQTFNIVVTAVNDAPTVATEIPDQEVEEDGEITFVVPAGTFDDDDGDALTLSAVEEGETDLPDFLTFDAETGTFTGTAPADDETQVSITVTANDGTDDANTNSVSDTFTIDFTPVDDAAVIGGDTTGEVGEDGVAADGTATGDLDSTDVDADDADDAFTAANDDATYGSWSIDAAGAWSYTLDDTNAEVDGLDDGDILTDSFTVETADGTEQEVTITIFGAPDFQFGDAGDDDIATGAGDDTISGGGGDDTLNGGAGDDAIFGGAGADTMTGGAGDDTISGGAGADVAVFAGDFDAFTFALSDDGRSLIVTDNDDTDGDEGTDTIRSDVETIRFGDGGTIAVTSERGLVTSSTGTNAGGNETSSSTTAIADDGRVTTETFEGGVRTSRQRVDSEDDVRTWSRIDETFDADGDVTSRDVTLDDGRRTVQSFEDGALTSRTRFDSEDDLRSWSQIEETFDADGDLVSRDVTLDDGRSIVSQFEDGELQSRVRVDSVDDVRGWSRIEETYDDGDLALRLLTLDNGRVIRTEFGDDGMAERSVFDAQSAQSWDDGLLG